MGRPRRSGADCRGRRAQFEGHCRFFKARASQSRMTYGRWSWRAQRSNPVSLFGFLSIAIAIANQAQTLDYSVTAFLATVDDCKWRY